jgi:hypothetical protein
VAARVQRIERLNVLRYGVAVELILRRCGQSSEPALRNVAIEGRAAYRCHAGHANLSFSFDFNNPRSILKDEFRAGMPILQDRWNTIRDA